MINKADLTIIDSTFLDFGLGRLNLLDPEKKVPGCSAAIGLQHVLGICITA